LAIDFLELTESILEKGGLFVHYSDEAVAQVTAFPGPPAIPEGCKDMTGLPWCSIDNDDTRDIDQLTYMEESEDKKHVTVYVAIADVSALVEKDTYVHNHAHTFFVVCGLTASKDRSTNMLETIRLRFTRRSRTSG
jgi:exoribonuclease-2